MKKYLVLLLIIILAGGFSCGKGSDTPESPNDKIKIVATTGMIADMAAQVGGDEVEVTGLMGPGVDPHLYKVSQGDIRKLAQADIILYNGLHLEGKMGDILEKLSQKKKVVAITGNVPDERLMRPAEFEGAPDPHIWFDVNLWRSTIPDVAQAIAEFKPAIKNDITANAEKYADTLDSLHTWVTHEINSIPESQRVLVTAHDAFGYFGKAYKIKVKGLQGISTLSEFGVMDISKLVSFISDNRLKAIFVESSVPEKSIQAVKQGSMEKGWNVEIGGTLYSDAMGGPGSGADSYVGMVRENVKTIVKALK